MKNNKSEKDNVYIEITITDDCNCNCSYCFEGKHCIKNNNNHIEEQKQLKLILDLCKKFDTTKHDWLTLSFWGGEPFLNLDYMCKIIENTYNYSFVRYHCFSNGTLVNKYKQFLEKPFINEIKNRFHVQLSYDGDPHNEIKRGYTKDKIIQTADLLHEVGIYFSFKATLAYDMICKLPEIWKSYEELFYKYPDMNVRYFPTLDTSVTLPEYFDVWKQKLIEVANLEYNFSKKHGFPLWSWFSEGHKMICKIKNTFHIHSDGNIYLCHGSPYIKNDKLKFGTTDNIDLNSLIYKTIGPTEILDSCLKCCATYCAVCHVTHLDENDDIYEGWITKRSSNAQRCKYFKYFGYISYLLKYIIIKNKVNNIT